MARDLVSVWKIYMFNNTKRHCHNIFFVSLFTMVCKTSLLSFSVISSFFMMKFELTQAKRELMVIFLEILNSAVIFMPLAWKVRRGHLVIGSSVRNSVPLANKVQYLKFGWSYNNQTWTVSSSKGCSHFTYITCPSGWGGVKIWDLEILP